MEDNPDLVEFGWLGLPDVINILKQIPKRDIGTLPDEIVSDNLPAHCCAVGKLKSGGSAIFINTYNFGASGTQHGQQSRVSFRSHLRGIIWLYELAVFVATGAPAPNWVVHF